MSTTKQIIERHDQFMTMNYPRYNVAMAEGLGSRITDAGGKEYLDLFRGFGAGILGHCHPDIVATGTKQMNKLWHVGNLLHTEPQTVLAEYIAEKGFGGRSYFCHSGSDANESAFKLARLYGGGKRYKIIATENSFHGRGFASMMATGQSKVREGFEPLLKGFSHVPYNDLDAMAEAIDDETSAIIVEPIQGEGGINIPDAGYLAGLRKLCDKHDLLLIIDEVWTGCGRTGQWFGYQHCDDVEPDIMTLGKAVGCGLAVGVMCASQRVARWYDVQNYGGVAQATTLGGNAVAMAVSARMFEIVERDKLVERAALLEHQIKTRFTKFSKKNPVVKNVRGRGVFLGIELDAEVGDVWFKDGAEIVDKCLDEGVLINAAQGNVLRLAPSLVITDEELDLGLTIVERVIAG